MILWLGNSIHSVSPYAHSTQSAHAPIPPSRPLMGEMGHGATVAPRIGEEVTWAQLCYVKDKKSQFLICLMNLHSNSLWQTDRRPWAIHWLWCIPREKTQSRSGFFTTERVSKIPPKASPRPMRMTRTCSRGTIRPRNSRPSTRTATAAPCTLIFELFCVRRKKSLCFILFVLSFHRPSFFSWFEVRKTPTFFPFFQKLWSFFEWFSRTRFVLKVDVL